MKKYVLLLLFLLLFQFGQASQIYADEPVKVGVYQNEPLVFTDSNGNVKGIYIDILEDVASKEGWSIQYVPCYWSQCLEWIEGGEIDLLVGIAYSEERDERFDFTDEVLLSNWGQLYTQKDSEIQSILDLEGKTIAVLKGDIYYQGFKLLLERFDIDSDFVEVDEYASVFQLVEEEKADAGVITRLYGLLHEKDYNIDRSTIICCPIELRFAVPENRNQNLVNALDTHLAALKNDKESIYYQSLNMWIGGLNGRVFPGWLKWMFAGVVGLLFLFLGGNIVLRAQVRAKTRELEEEITERKKAEEVLEDERFKLLEYFENLPLLAYNISLDGKIVNCNKTVLETLGYENKEELLGKPLVTTIYAPSSQEKAKKLFHKWKETGVLVNEELQIITKNGEVKDVLLSVDTIYDKKGNRLYTISTQLDITDHKKLEKETQKKIKELEDFYKMAVGRELKMVELKKEVKKLKKEIEKLSGGRQAGNKESHEEDLNRREL